MSKVAMYLAIVGGIFLLISGAAGGLGFLQNVLEFASAYSEVAKTVLIALLFIASLGGIAVIIGGILIGKEFKRIGKFLIMIGAGIGLIGLLIGLGLIVAGGGSLISYFLSFGTLSLIGVVLSVAARFLA